MRIRTVMGFAVVSIMSVACSGGDHPAGPGPVMCNYPGLGSLKASDPLCVAPPPSPTVSLTPLPSNAMVGDTLTEVATCTNTVSFSVVVTAATVLTTLPSQCTSSVTFRFVLTEVGTAKITATATGASGTIPANASVTISVTQRPVLSTLDTVTVSLFSPEASDSPPTGMKALFVWWIGAAKDSLMTSVVGNTATAGLPIGRDSIEVRLNGDPTYSNDRKVVLYRGDYYHRTVSIILEPVSWKIRAPQYAGQLVSLDFRLCSIAAGPTDPVNFCQFLKKTKTTGGTAKTPIRWASTSFPVKMGILWGKSTGFDRNADSLYFANTMIPMINQYLGENTVVNTSIAGDTVPPGTIGIILGDNTWDDPGSAGGGIVTNASGDIYSGTLTLPSRIYLEQSQQSVIVHEFMHIMGIGHTCGWITLMISINELSGNCSGKRALFATPVDVAMYEMSTAIWRKAKDLDTVFAFN